MKTYIDMDTYPRRSHFDYFRNMAYPYVGLTANVDVTNLLARANQLGASGFLTILWAASRAANAIPQLRQRIEGEVIVEYDHSDVGYTVALPDHTFCNCHVDCRGNLEDFLPYARAKQEEASRHHGFLNDGEDESGMMFVSCVPWVAFTQCVQPVPCPGDSNPRIVFGKYIREGGRTLMPLHIQCNHALVDGYHLGEFYRIFDETAASV